MPRTAPPSLSGAPAQGAGRSLENRAARRVSGQCGCPGTTAHPPLPLHELRPLQPWLPVLQPPCPLHAFIPLHPCLTVAHPPFPLQELCPLQPWLPVLHPPCPLHAFIPLQACLPGAANAGSTSTLAASPATLSAIIFANSRRFIFFLLFGYDAVASRARDDHLHHPSTTPVTPVFLLSRE